MPEKRTLIEGKDERSLLTGVYLLAVTTFEIKRSDDGKVITIELKVDIPQLFKEFEFEKISKFIE